MPLLIIVLNSWLIDNSSSDHCQVNFDIFVDCNASTQPADVQKFDWMNANYDGMSYLLLNTDWPRKFLENPTAELFWQSLRSIIEHEQAIDGNVTVLSSCVGDGLSARRRISYHVGIRRIMARKHCLWRQFKRHPTDWALYSQ